MNTTTEQVCVDTQATTEKPAVNYNKLTKAQLIRRLESARFIMCRMRDYYLESAAKWGPYSYSSNSDQAYANAMKTAIELITEDPDRKYSI